MSPEYPEVRITIQTLANATRYHIVTVSKMLDWLEAYRFILKVGRGRYLLNPEVAFNGRKELRDKRYAIFIAKWKKKQGVTDVM
jgi:DNA-binding IclR family transcriptional regulator